MVVGVARVRAGFLFWSRVDFVVTTAVQLTPVLVEHLLTLQWQSGASFYLQFRLQDGGPSHKSELLPGGVFDKSSPEENGRHRCNQHKVNKYLDLQEAFEDTFWLKLRNVKNVSLLKFWKFWMDSLTGDTCDITSMFYVAMENGQNGVMGISVA